MAEGEAQLEGASRHFAAVGSARSILAALEAESRPIHAICASEEKHGADFARIERLPSAVIEKRAQGNTHGGLLARVGARRYSALASSLPPCGIPSSHCWMASKTPIISGRRCARYTRRVWMA